MPEGHIPQRLQRVLAARWLFGLVSLIVGVGAAVISEGRYQGGIVVGLAVVTYNSLLVILLHRRPTDSPPPSYAAAQLCCDSIATVVAIHYGLALTPAVQFLFLFPLFVATLLCPREGLFLTAALCAIGYALSAVAGMVGWWPPDPDLMARDPLVGALAAVGMVVGALLAAATILNYLVRTLAAIERDLAESERKYRRLAGSLEDEVRRRTVELRGANETLNARNRELLRFQEINAAIHGSADLATVLGHVVDGIAEIVPDCEAAIYLLDPAGDRLRLAAYSSLAERRIAAIEALVGRPVDELSIPLRPGTQVEHAVRAREPLHTTDPDFLVLSHAIEADDPRDLLTSALAILNYVSLAALPLESGGTFIGLLVVGARRPLSPTDLERLAAFATQAGIAAARRQQESELMEQQAALEQAYHELERSQEQVVQLERMRALGEMTSGIAHNFNNHLQTILGKTQMMLNNNPPDSLVAQLRSVEQAAQDAEMLVRRIRAFVVGEQPHVSIVDPNQLVEDALAQTEPRWRHHIDRVEFPIQVRRELTATRPVEVDPGAFREVLVNIILNAVLAMPNGGQLHCRTWDQDDRVMFSIRDTGTGMSEEVRRRCFEPLFTTRGPEQGTGLGLSVAYGVIRRHGGTITVDSALGRGSTFTIDLPAAVATAPSSRPVDTPVYRPTETQRVCALVVDDQRNVRETLGEMLTELGHEVTVVGSGREAIDAFDPSRHRVVITDWGMPGMSGLAVARAIKGRSPSTKVLLLTGFDANIPPEVLEAREIDSRLQKPLDLADVADAVDRLLASAEGT